MSTPSGVSATRYLDGVFVEENAAFRVVAAPPPTRGELLAIAVRVVARVTRWLKKHGYLRGETDSNQAMEPNVALRRSHCMTHINEVLGLLGFVGIALVTGCGAPAPPSASNLAAESVAPPFGSAKLVSGKTSATFELREAIPARTVQPYFSQPLAGGALVPEVNGGKETSIYPDDLLSCTILRSDVKDTGDFPNGTATITNVSITYVPDMNPDVAARRPDDNFGKFRLQLAPNPQKWEAVTCSLSFSAPSKFRDDWSMNDIVDAFGNRRLAITPPPTSGSDAMGVGDGE